MGSSRWDHLKEQWQREKAQVSILRTYSAVSDGRPIKGVRTSRGVLVPCVSGHRDSTPSLHLMEQENIFRAHCCDEGGDAAQLVRFAGLAKGFGEALEYLEKAGLFKPAPEPAVTFVAARGHNGKSVRLIDENPAGHFDYEKLDRSVAYRVVRIEGYDPEILQSALASGMSTDDARRDAKTKRFDQQHPGHDGPNCATCSVRLVRLLERATKDGWSNDFVLRLLGEQFGAATPGQARDMMASKAVPGHPGEFRFGTDGIERIPFRLPELTAAVKARKPVFFVEGEKKVVALESLGLVATCAANGGTWRMPPEWGEYFRGADRVIILPDCDEPGRERCAKPRLHTLRAAGVRSSVLDLDPTRTDGYDIADWVDERKALHPDVILAELRTKWQNRMSMRAIA